MSQTPVCSSERIDQYDLVSHRLARGAAALGISLTSTQLEGLLIYLSLLERWNRAFNLTAVRNPLEMVPRHLFDSLVILSYLHGNTVLDVGTGAGLPGMPLAICDPSRQYFLLDGNGKKLRFVRQAVMELGLDRVDVVHCRMESYQPGRKFSTIVSRAVATIAQVLCLASPLLERSGCLLVLKGQYPQEELQDPALSNVDLTVHKLSVPELKGERHLIEIRCE